MAVVHRSEERTVVMQPGSYENEAELHRLLATHPHLLSGADEPEVSFVASELNLGKAGKLDLLLVDQEGQPIVVEVKLARNFQSRREVVAQALDYVSSLGEYTAQELDDLVEGALAAALQAWEEEEGTGDFGRTWKRCGSLLRAGELRVIVAMDSAPSELVRIMRFLNDHSDLDIRLIEIAKYHDEDGGELFVPNVIIRNANIEEAPRKRVMPEALARVLSIYNATADEDRRTTGRASHYRQIKLSRWPGSLHYEFLSYAPDRVGVELHLESKKVAPLKKVLEVLPEDASEILPELTWDPRWSKGRGRLRRIFDGETEPDVIAAYMKKLIAHTAPIIDADIGGKDVPS